RRAPAPPPGGRDPGRGGPPMTTPAPAQLDGRAGAIRLAEELGAALVELSMLLRRAILPPQISLTQAWTLLILHDSGPQRVTSLADAASVTQPTMSGCIIGMERLGWVRRDTGGTDRRVVTVYLTEDGEKVMHDLEEARTRVLLADLE